jgi:hypothetical protein
MTLVAISFGLRQLDDDVFDSFSGHIKIHIRFVDPSLCSQEIRIAGYLLASILSLLASFHMSARALLPQRV